MGRIYGKDAIERAMTQVLEENLVSSERIRQLVSEMPSYQCNPL